jgi:hypothetical protein
MGTQKGIKIDPIVESVRQKFQQRSAAGQLKYETTLDRTDLTTKDWLTHAQEEAMDFVLYLERLLLQFDPVDEDADTETTEQYEAQGNGGDRFDR